MDLKYKEISPLLSKEKLDMLDVMRLAHYRCWCFQMLRSQPPVYPLKSGGRLEVSPYSTLALSPVS